MNGHALKRLIMILLSGGCVLPVSAQTDSITVSQPLRLSALADVYYAYDFSQPSDHNLPPFVYNYHRHNEVNLNLAYFKASYETNQVRGNLTLMTGTYAQRNLAHEPALLRPVMEANAGAKLLRNKSLWLDAGVLPSHIGFESAVSTDCWTLTRSMLADNSPYYEAGARLSYTTASEKIYLAVLYLNGWQRIQRVAGSSAANFGTQITYRPSVKVRLNYSTFYGSNQPDSLGGRRFFQNLYLLFQPSEKLGIVAGFDLGMENNHHSQDWRIWHSAACIVRYQVARKLAAACRAEYYDDADGVVVTESGASGLRMGAASVNADYDLARNLKWRVEGKYYQQLQTSSSATYPRFVFTTSLVFSMNFFP